jgi:hypothetical protein
MEAASDELIERHAIMAGDVGQADMDFVFVILSADVDGWARFGH